MLVYKTILGEIIDIDELTCDTIAYALKILSLIKEYDGKDAFKYASECREEIFNKIYRLNRKLRLEAFRGPIGKIYRDGFYRIYAQNSKGKNQEEFFDSLRYNPLRPLFDRFLDGNWRFQSEFTKSAGLANAQVSKIFQSVLGGEESGEISIKKLSEAMRALDIVSTVSDNNYIPNTDEISTRPTSPTTREWMLIMVVSSVTRCLCQIKNDKDVAEEVIDCRNVLAQYLSFMYDIKDIHQLNDFTYLVLREILTLFPSNEEMTLKDLLVMVTNPDYCTFTFIGGTKTKYSNSFHLLYEKTDDLPPSPLSFEPITSSALRTLKGSHFEHCINNSWKESKDLVKHWAQSTLAHKKLEQFLQEIKCT